MPFAEANYENAVIELFQNMGYTHLYGPDITMARCYSVCKWPSSGLGGAKIPFPRGNRRFRGILTNTQLHARNSLHLPLQHDLCDERPADQQGRNHYQRRKPLYGVENQGWKL